MEEAVARFRRLSEGLAEMRGYFDVERRRAQLQQLEAAAAATGFWDDAAAARRVIDQANAQRAFVKPHDALARLIEDAGVMMEMAGAEPEGHARDLALSETAALLDEADEVAGKLRLQSLLSGPMDACNAFLTLHAGAGGTESCDWADMLFRMYRHYCEDHGFELEVLDSQPGEEAGLKSVTFNVRGAYAYGYMKAERGVHRLVRISPFDANKRRHTSFCALDVVAELADDADIEVNDEDLRVDTYRSGGAGGQHINKTDSAVRLTHLPTGIVVSCQSERSQHKNRSKAMSMLKAKLYEYEQDKKRRDLERFYGEKGEIAWGSQIRSYVLQPYTLAKDHRTGEETSNIQAVLDGAIQPFIEAYLRHAARGAHAQKGEVAT
ncbi:MAG: peptide chain release factor 2 [Kiritimatiellae bacterium]|nr:peptide chain release factor 2 [Kiritimatiellia bacterium]